ncbi:MAG: hypothetical protein ABS70_00330 [Nitrospira sp. SCN 59-13]|nr:MAG: hypothetical protein ABS70_00330 [Nitrospira sp. SCN 59-13]
MAELTWRTCWSRCNGPPLEILFDFTQETWRHAPLLDLLTGRLRHIRCLCLFSGHIDRIAGCEHEAEEHPAPCEATDHRGVHGFLLWFTFICLPFPRKSAGRRLLHAA